MIAPQTITPPGNCPPRTVAPPGQLPPRQFPPPQTITPLKTPGCSYRHMHIRKFHSETRQICEHFSEGLQFFSQTVLPPDFHIFLCMFGVTRGKFLQKMAVLRFTIGPTEPPFWNQILSISGRRVCLFEYVCCCFSSKSLRARNRGRVRVEKLPAFSPFPTMFYCLPKTNFISIITIILSSANVSIWTSLKFC